MQFSNTTFAVYWLQCIPPSTKNKLIIITSLKWFKAENIPMLSGHFAINRARDKGYSALQQKIQKLTYACVKHIDVTSVTELSEAPEK